MIVRSMAVACLLFVAGSRLLAQEYSASSGEAAPTGTIAPEISSLLEAKGIKVNKGSTAVCELWFAKEWPIEADAKTGGINVQWTSTRGEILQIIANFANHAILRPALVEGETLWGMESTKGHLYLHPDDILVRVGKAGKVQLS